MQNFAYTGAVQSYTTPATGWYGLEVWGAQGGYDSSSNGFSGTAYAGKVYGGSGGYGYGRIYLNSNTTLFIGVGEIGKTSNGTTGLATNPLTATAFNGGGKGSGGGSGGGGATHIAYKNNRGILANYSSYKTEVLLVAGGGGGRHHYKTLNLNYAFGGGATAGIGYSDQNNGETISSATTSGPGVNARDSSCNGSFGTGGNSNQKYSNSDGGGGGGGYYGGAASVSEGCGVGGGGSGYASNELSASSLIAGNQTFKAPNGSNETGHAGNGYARITYLGTNI